MEQVEFRREVPIGQRTRWGLRSSLAMVGAAVSVLALAVVDSGRVASHAALSNVAFGMPLNWLNQNQSALDPPLSYRTRLLSPWEYPTGLSMGGALIDVFVVLALLASVWFLVRSMRAAR